MLIDDHALFRAGLEGLLEQRGIEVVASVGDGQQGLDAAEREAPDVILLDMRMPEMNGFEVLQELKAKGIESAIMVLTTSAEERDLVRSLRNGARGYLLKDIAPDELVKALHRIVDGEFVVSDEFSGILAKVIHGTETESDELVSIADLTPREREILCHLAEGQSNKVIANQLGISDGTVKLHVKAILRKLNIHSRVEAAVFAVEQGLCRQAT